MSRNLLKSLINPGLVSLVAAGWSLAAGAHVSVANGPLFSGKTHEIVLSMPHGCSQVVDGVSRSFDTARVEVTVPAQITGVRPVDAVFGSAIAEKNAQGQVVKLVWKKS